LNASAGGKLHVRFHRISVRRLNRQGVVNESFIR
jgi:hypothetical protein